MPSNRYVALRTLKHGDREYQAGEEVPFTGNENLGPLLEGGYLASVPFIGAPLEDALVDGANTVQDEEGKQEQAADDSNDDSTTPEGDDDADDASNGDDSEDGSEGETVEDTNGLGIDLGTMNVEDVIEWAEANKDRIAELVAAETAGRGRKTLLAQLTTMVTS